MSGLMTMEDDTPLLECEAPLHEAARQATGFSEFGPDEYREGLRMLLETCEQESNLTPAGRLLVKSQVFAGLQGRLHSEAGFQRFPEALEVPIERPMVIIGMPRTASTPLHRMLSRDPNLQGLEMWVAESPMPRPPRDQWPGIPAFTECDTRTRAIYEASPEMRAIHEMDADEVDECWHLFRQSFGSVTFECNFRIPGYSRWWATSDMGPAYRRYRRNLQLIGLNEPGRRWLLKDATHMFHLDRFFETFPDICVVTTMRDPVKMIPSVASLTAVGLRSVVADFDPHAHGRAQFDLWKRGLERIERICGVLPPERLHRMDFDDFQSDPVAEVRRIYDRFDFELSREAETAMRQWHEANRRGRHGGHDYSPEEFGLSAEEIRAAFR
ncbi:MAG: sulfotransferase [Myxococcota bacterium]